LRPEKPLVSPFVSDFQACQLQQPLITLKHMKKLRSLVLVLAFASAAAVISAAPGTATFDVTVKQKPGGNAVFKGKTDGRGNFTTPELNPGSYTAEFRSSQAAAMKGRNITITINSGKGQSSQSTAPAEKFASGVGMTFDIKKASKLTGQIGAEAGTEAVANIKGGTTGNVKIINGKRYVWMPPELGSNMGGKWVPEGSPGVPRANIQRGNRDGLQRMQDHSGQGAVPGG
jgi:hypothetical protein